MLKKSDMKIRVDYNNMMQECIGKEGICTSEIDEISEKIKTAQDNMIKKRESGKMDWRDLPYNQSEVVKDIIYYVNEIKDKIEAFVVLGIGGSALGPLAVHQAINHPYYNEISREKRGNFPKLYILDNVDPEKLSYFFDIVDIKKCLFNVISKSGSTSETMSQFMIIKDMLEKELGHSAKNHIVATTDKENGNLIKIAKEENYKTFIIPSGVGGRFSELTPVGLLPACFCGINIQEMLDGAGYMDSLCKETDIYKNPAHIYAILNYLSMIKGKNISVMMPYAESLKFISDWYAQLWAESLGKRLNNSGNVVNTGQTPVKALGVTDQHSQVQLYVHGPFDKVVVFIGVDEYRKTITIPKIYEDMPAIGFLGGVTHNDLIKVEQMSTEYALLKAEKTNMTITLPKVNEFTIGQILYMFEVATAFCGELMDINAFDQPGVEEGKNATYAMFNRSGYEEKRDEIENRPKKKPKYIC